MTTISAVATGGYVTLTITPTEEITSIGRNDSNGATTVRVPPGTFPRTTPVTLIDWEASIRGVVNYWTNAAAGATGTTVTAFTKAPYLVTPLRPSQSLELEAVGDYSAGRTSLGTVYQVPDRPDPLAALGRLTARTGTLSIWCADHATAALREAVLDMTGVAMLKTPDQAGMDMYFITNGTDKAENEDGRSWTLSVDYTEVSRPTSPINSSAWTFGTVAASYGSFANLSSSYEDFEGLSLNDQTGVNL